MADEQSVLLTKYGEVHRDVGRGATACGKPVPADAVYKVTDKQVRVFSLARCLDCCPRGGS